MIHSKTHNTVTARKSLPRLRVVIFYHKLGKVISVHVVMCLCIAPNHSHVRIAIICTHKSFSCTANTQAPSAGHYTSGHRYRGVPAHKATEYQWRYGCWAKSLARVLRIPSTFTSVHRCRHSVGFHFFTLQNFGKRCGSTLCNADRNVNKIKYNC